MLNLFSRNPNGESLSAEFVSMLKGQGAAHICDAGIKTVIIEFSGDWWTIHDNGGEVCVEKINTPESVRSVPYESNAISMDVMTIVYRVLCALRGEPIDYLWCAEMGSKI